MHPLVVGPIHAQRAPFLELSEEAWSEMIEDVRGAFFTLQWHARHARPGGRAVVVSSPAAARAIPGMTLEAVAGAFLTTAAQVAAVELKPRGITANVVVPGLRDDLRTVAALLRFLGSEEASGVTGAIIAADGGFSVTKDAPDHEGEEG